MKCAEQEYGISSLPSITSWALTTFLVSAELGLELREVFSRKNDEVERADRNQILYRGSSTIFIYPFVFPNVDRKTLRTKQLIAKWLVPLLACTTLSGTSYHSTQDSYLRLSVSLLA